MTALLWTQLEFLNRNVPGYICNPSSLRELDAASRGHTYHPAIGQITRVFRAGHGEGAPIASPDASSCSLEETSRLSM